jgi:hypothetical protein
MAPPSCRTLEDKENTREDKENTREGTFQVESSSHRRHVRSWQILLQNDFECLSEEHFFKIPSQCEMLIQNLLFRGQLLPVIGDQALVGDFCNKTGTLLPSAHEVARPVLCRFSDAGNDDLTTRSGNRRPKSAKARNRGR